MAIPSAALAYKRSALMTATKVTVKPPSEEVLKARDDFQDFCKYMGKPPAKHMLEWHAELCTGVDSECLIGIGGPNTSILAPRGSAKSTVLGLFAAWMIGRHAAAKQMLRILYIAYMVDISRAKSATIKGILTSNKYREIFPMVRLSKIKRSDEYWSIDYDFAGIDTAGEEAFTIACGGLKGAITSKRSQLVLIDDPIKSAASINNPDIRREMEQTWSNVIAPTMFQGARAICLGTRFHFDDVHAKLFTAKNNWKQIVQKAVITDEEGRTRSYWPEFWSMKYLNDRKSEDRVAFAYQYLNTAVQSSEVGISPELIVKGEVPDEYDCLGVGIDLSCGLGEKNDYTVFTLGGISKGKIFLIDQRRVRSMGNIEKMDTLCAMLADWNILVENEDEQYFPTMSTCIIWPEAVAYQTSFEGDFKRIMFDDRSLFNLTCSPVKGFKGDKLARLRGVLGLFEKKRVVWNKYRKWDVLEEELLNFGHSAHDDAVDSMVLTMGGLLRRGALQLDYNSDSFNM
jgi:phage terminase large subunit-like protein